MRLHFVKYHGTGNDFILIDNRSGDLQLLNAQIKHLCDRNFGIGSDGLILIENSETSNFYMNFYNPDGSQSFCGNGSRCAFVFAHSLGMVNNEGRFHAIDGEHFGKIENNLVHIKMKDVLSFELTADSYFMDTGSPHFIIYQEGIDDINILEEAHKIRYNKRFKEAGTNVNFVEAIDAQTVQMRTYERGVENETLSCGTGVTAVALSYKQRNSGLKSVQVHTSGGTLHVSSEYIHNRFENIWLIGPAQTVFKGSIEL